MTMNATIKETLAGVWHNQHNSQIHLEIDESGKIAGYFLNGINSPGGRSESYPLTGFARGDVFSFCVDFSKHGCMTTWVGQIVEERRFQAMWQMISDVHQNKDLCWKSTWIGQDTFEFGPRESEICDQPCSASYPLYCSLI
ncbi:MAG TPA: hypothetical protein EYN91_05490 [Candidatus Melainabacteria bacterium]|jgi:hypothetical protein|nr:hypothetical protein [Candidatus Melainabacteria bacterium]HIN63175.1 hypothetical protein [Candidatus Obscuribacterales bacterium]